MVVVDRRDGNTRYWLLETLREYGRAQFPSIRTRRTSPVEVTSRTSWSFAEQAGSVRPLRLESLARLDTDRNNLERP